MSSRRPSIPRPPPSPLRPGSPPVNPSPLSSQPPSTGTLLSARRATPTSPPKTRARDLLRKHYGLGVGLPPVRSWHSPAFDAKAYYEQLITTSTLPALLKQENELVSEIRELDKRADTIAAMKSRAESLDADLDLLKAAFSEISRLAEEVAVQSQSAESKDI
ncbi:hypothetical protein F5146DRAFT_1134609 [Armillaria mellea]|nr:hypothetical protein F5146DRAFT_1134609 [Armillaria mellea]